MRSIRIVLGIAFILGGLLLGAYVTLHYFSLGIGAIRDGNLGRGLMLLAVWSEVIGIASMLALVFPGAMLLRSVERRPAPVRERVS